ncbi:MAG: HdeD family acid-resistance protein [Acidimicrobiales bacterium]
MLEELGRRSSTTLIVSGILAIVFGLVAAFWPIGTAVTLVIVWGIYALVDGISDLVAAFEKGISGGLRFWLLFSAVVGILAGILAIFRPGISMAAIAWVLGVWMLVRGIFEIVAAIGGSGLPHRWLLALGGALWIVAGIVFVNNPAESALSVALWLGILAIAWGVTLVIAGFMFRNGSSTPATV